MFNFVCNYKVNSESLPLPFSDDEFGKKKIVLYLGKYGTSAKGDGGNYNIKCQVNLT